MMNWLWIIPWVMVAVFALGWHFGGKAAERRVYEKHEHDDYARLEREAWRHTCATMDQKIDELRDQYYKLLRKSETREENSNG